MTDQNDQKTLPILQFKDKILNSINDYPVTIITGETGCGKTTKVPQFILDDARSSNTDVNILVTQPRKIAAISIARRVASELNVKVGGLVGYQVGLDKKLNKMDSEQKTQILFCTTGVVLQKLIKLQSMDSFSHIILDEIHERDIDTDLLMAIIREFIRDKNSDTRLILMSATLNSKKFQKYFTLLTDKGHIVPPVIAMKIERPFKINVLYLDDLITDKELNKEIIDYQRKIYITTEMYQFIVEIVMSHLDTSDKSILIFLPGIFEIECMHTTLMRQENIEEKCLITVLHAKLPSSEQRQVFVQSTLPKVILSTNIAESSITLPNIGAVVDLCLAKCMAIEKGSSMASLKLHWISKQNCQQRAGRTGRVCDGRVYRMVHRRYYADHLLDETEAEIMRAPLETTILRIKMLERQNENPITILNKCMNTPETESILNSILILKEVGGLHAYDLDENFMHTDGELTFIGRVMASIPIDVRLSKLIVMGYIFNVIEDAIILAAALSLNSIFQNRYNKKMEDYKLKLKMSNGTGCDALTMMNAYKQWLLKSQEGSFRDWESENEWCNKNNLERKNVHEMRQLINEIKHRLTDFKLEAIEEKWELQEVPFILKVCLAAALYPHYFILGNSDRHVEREVYKGLLGLDPNRTVFYRNMKLNQIGEVYIDQIKKKMIQSGFIDNADDLKFAFDSSKIFVEFPDKGMIDVDASEDSKECVVYGKILPKIYEGVKLRKLILAKESMQRSRCHDNKIIPTLRLKVLPSNKTRDYAVDKGYALIEDYRVKISRQKYSHPCHVAIPQFHEMEKIGRITNIEHCGNFFFQIEESSDFDWLAIIQAYFEEIERDLELATPLLKKLVVIHYKNNYYRGKIVKIHEDATADCYFFDYGYTIAIPFNQIYEANKDIIENAFRIPERGFQCKLSQIEPSFVKCPRGKWTMEAIECFSAIALDQPCKLKIYSFVNEIATVEVLIEENSVNDFLVDVEFAVRCREPYVSRLNYNERVGLQYSIQDHPKKFKEFSDRENQMIVPYIEPPEERKCTDTIYLEGPFSPLETSVFGLFENASSLAKIDQFSVNSVQLDTCVENYDGQMLIAADIIKNPPNEATLHCITAMPNIRGLPALIMMMFAPKTIFECNKNFERILKVKSNIGYDLKNEPFFPSHQCDAPVNFKLSPQDCDEINEFRFTMSMLLKVGRNEQTPELCAIEKKKFMLKVKDLMVKILQRQREERDPLEVVSNGVIATAADDKIVRKIRNRAFAFNQVEFPKLKENIEE